MMDQGRWTKRILFVLFCLIACSPSKPASPTLATVNEQKITLDDFGKALTMEQWKFGSEGGLTPAQAKQLKTQVLETLLKDALLLEEADKRGITIPDAEVEKSVGQFKNYYAKEDDFEKLLQVRGLTLKDFKEQRRKELRIKKLSEQVTVEQIKLTPEVLKKYYEAHLSEFSHPEQVRARQIVTDTKEKADALRKMLIDGASFEETAAKYSLSPDRKEGGDLGWFGRGIMPQEFDHVCFGLKPKALSPVVKSPYGFHLFEVLETRGAGQFSFDEVEADIQKRLMQSEGRDVFQKWYDGLRAAAKLEVHQELLNKAGSLQ